MMPLIRATRSSIHSRFPIFTSPISPVASPLTTTEDAWVPVFPPMAITTGKKNDREIMALMDASN
ncbi:conserved hypothetical protein [delta proteobacterium NaphS2]|nr:conserved hypothetical protein [delta proteobacterium NaphS2]